MAGLFFIILLTKNCQNEREKTDKEEKQCRITKKYLVKKESQFIFNKAKLLGSLFWSKGIFQGQTCRGKLYNGRVYERYKLTKEKNNEKRVHSLQTNKLFFQKS